MSREHISALVLAAGMSTRMGRCKLDLPWNDSTILGSVLTALDNECIERIVVVSGAYPAEVETIVRSFTHTHSEAQVETVQNPKFNNGEMTDSIRVGLERLQDSDGVLITLGDQPNVEPDIVRKIIKTFISGNDLVVPSYSLRRGHPWLVSNRYFQDLEHLSARFTMRDFLNSHSQEIAYIEADRQSTFLDIDSWDDYILARAGEGGE
jgi:molybdenum cofactor cytidylyltransferase